MFDNTPNNLPTGGKSMLDNITEKMPASVPPPASQSVPRPVPRSSESKVGSSKSEAGSPGNEIGPKEILKSVAPPPASMKVGAAEDMFLDMKDSPIAGHEQSRGATREIASVETPRQGFKKILIIAVAIIIFAGVLGFGGYWIYNNILKPKPLSPNLNINNPPAEAGEQTETPAPEQAAPAPVDSDNDGLIDSEEVRLSTDALNPDTDGDRLFDGEEINVYSTDPLNKDTDGDGFEDGSEVQNGYDPKGPGKLIRIPVGQ